MKTTTTRQRILLSSIANEAIDYVEEVPALSIEDEDQPQIVCRSSSGRLEIVDGFHRTAGQIRYCRENEIELSDAVVLVIETDDEDLIADAAEPGPDQQAAIDDLYRQAGV